MSKKRELNMELLRILSMFMVIILHALLHGGTLKSYEINTIGYIFFWLLQTACIIAVNCFVLISGFFMIGSELKLSKIIKVVIQVEMFSILGTIIGCYIFNQEFTLQVLLMTIFPLTNESYWFVTHYIILMLFSPFLNKLIHSLEKRDFEKLLVVEIVVFSIIPTIFLWSRRVLGTGYNFVWFIVLYCIAAYIRLYGLKFGKKWICLYIALAIVGVVSRLVIGNATLYLFGVEKGTDLLYSYNSILVLVMSIVVFMFFTKVKIKTEKMSKAILFLSTNSFGVYLCHEHFMIRQPLWELVNITKLEKYGVGITFLYILLVAIVIYILGCTIEYVRIKIIEKNLELIKR